MTLYRVRLDNNRKHLIEASSKDAAANKYYKSPSHFRTEASVVGVAAVSKLEQGKRKVKRRRSNYGFGIRIPSFRI